MTEKSSKYCALTYKSICVNSSTKVVTCCAGEETLTPFTSLRDLTEQFTGRRLSEIKKELESGVFPQNCSICHDFESVGVKSHRLQDGERIYMKPLNRIGEGNEPQNLLALDLAFSNICNLDCAFCHSQFSSKWIETDQTLLSLGLRGESQVRDKIHQWPAVSVQDWEEFLRQAPHLKEIELKGGEPLLAPQFKTMMQALKNLKRTEIFLNIVTNGTFLKQEMVDEFSDFTGLLFSFSMDGVGLTYEYIRGFDFETVVKNIDYYFKNTMVKDRFFTFTLCNLNILHLPEYCSWLQKKFGVQYEHIHLSLRQWVISPSYLAPWVIPIQYYQRAIDGLYQVLDQEYPFVNSSDIHSLINEFESRKGDDISVEIQSFQRFLPHFEKKRKLKFDQLYPDWNWTKTTSLLEA